MLGGCGGDFPLVGGLDCAGSDVSGVDDGRFAGERSAAVLMDFLAQRMADAGDPVVGEDALLFVEHPVGDSFCESGAVNAQRVFLADRLVPTTKKEARVIDVMVEMVVREEKVIDIRRPQPRLHQLMRSRRPTIEHDLLTIDIRDVRRAEARGRGSWSSGAEDVEGGGEFGVGHGGSLGVWDLSRDY